MMETYKSKFQLITISIWKASIIGVGNGNPLQYSCLDNPMDRGAWRAMTR